MNNSVEDECDQAEITDVPIKEDDDAKIDDEGVNVSLVETPGRKGVPNFSRFAYLPPSASNNGEPPMRRSPRIGSILSSKALTETIPPKRKSSHSSTSSPSPSKRIRSPAGYAPPSKYAHLPPLPDRIAEDLLVLFVGLNPGVRTAQDGHAYAHPSNLFWKLLHSSGCTTRRCLPAEDVDLPRLFSLGNTNIVSRATRNGSELSKKEMDDAVGILEDKIRKYRPESVCIVGKSIWESVWRVRHGRSIKKEEFKYGWQDELENMGAVLNEWDGAKTFVATSTSGLAATTLPAEKERIWRQLGVWVETRRLERAAGVTVKVET